MENEAILTTVRERQRRRFADKASQVSARYLRRLEELPDMPEALRPFLERLRTVYVDGGGVSRLPDAKLIGTYCVMAPQELIYAAGGQPVRLCSGSYTAFSIGDDLTPRDACPLVKAVAGFVDMDTMPLYGDCDLMVVPITCDCKKKIAALLARSVPTCALHVPAQRRDDEGMEMYRGELYRLLAALEETTGRRTGVRELQSAIELLAGAQCEYSRFLKYRRQVPALIRGSHVMAMMNAFSYMPAGEWTGYLRALNAELEARLAAGRFAARANQPRILLTGSPVVFPNLKIPLLIEENGGVVAADETCMGERALYDPVAVADRSFDGLMRALANRAVRPCSCPTFADNGQRLYRIRQMIESHAVQGVIYHVLRGCLVYDYEYKLLEDELARLDIPVIRLESDYNEEDVEQLRVRIEAFVELIKLRELAAQKRRREGES